MSNVWYYRLLIDPRPAFPVEKVARIVELATARGFSVSQPETGRITMATVDIKSGDYRSYEFDEFTQAATLLGQAGGLLDLWKEDYHIGLSFDPTGADEANLIETSRLPDILAFGHLSISVGAYLFRDYQEDRAAVARDVEGLFADLCISQKARYGFSLDEDAFESFASRMRIHEEAKSQYTPSVLFWLNYFTAEHWAQIEGHDKLQQIGGKMSDLPTGVLVSFFEVPWAVDVGKLLSINESWRDLQH